MLKIEPPNYQFCPFCGHKLKTKLEEEKERQFCSSCGWVYYPHVAGAAEAIITRKDKVLLVKRARDPYKGTWMFPAGFIDFGEHPEETIVREVKEETGMQATQMRLFKILQCEDDPRSPGHFLYFYKVKAKGDLKIEDHDENSAIGWFEIENPPEIGWQAHRKVMKMLREELKKRQAV